MYKRSFSRKFPSKIYRNIMRRPKIVSIASLLATAGLHAGNPAMPETMLAPAESGWRFRFAPYVWLIAIDGDMGIGPFTAPVDISFSDTLDKLDMAYMFLAEAGYGRWTLNADFIYGDFSNVTAGPAPIDSISYEYTQWVLTTSVGYRVTQSEDHSMDAFVGARITDFDAGATAFLTGNAPIQRGRSDRWIDPIIGIRGQSDLNERFMLRYNADVGGFGASSDLIWQAFVGLGYRMTDHSSVAIGYRALGVDFTSNEFSPLDVINHGPLSGFEFRF